MNRLFVIALLSSSWWVVVVKGADTSPLNKPCFLCGDENSIVENPEASFTFSFLGHATEYVCGELEAQGHDGFVTPGECQALQNFIPSSPCGCVQIDDTTNNNNMDPSLFNDVPTSSCNLCNKNGLKNPELPSPFGSDGTVMTCGEVEMALSNSQVILADQCSETVLEILQSFCECQEDDDEEYRDSSSQQQQQQQQSSSSKNLHLPFLLTMAGVFVIILCCGRLQRRAMQRHRWAVAQEERFKRQEADIDKEIRSQIIKLLFPVPKKDGTKDLERNSMEYDPESHQTLKETGTDNTDVSAPQQPDEMSCGGDVNPSIVNQALNTTVETTETSFASDDIIDDDDDLLQDYANACTICFEPMDENDIVKGTCSHTFHHECMMAWLEKDHDTCPTCRTLMWDEEEYKTKHDEIKAKRAAGWKFRSLQHEFFIKGPLFLLNRW